MTYDDGVASRATLVLEPHRLAHADFVGIAEGGGTPEAVERLLESERSWRKVQFKAVLETVLATPDVTGPLPPISDAWDLLSRAERQSPETIDAILLHPHAGTWAGYLLRRLRGSVDGDTPVWVDLGYLHALAVVAGAAAGMTFTLPVPHRGGFVALPTLGGAELATDEPWGTALVTSEAGRLTITLGGNSVDVDDPASASPGWVPLPAVSAEASGRALSIVLDHVDPYRNLRTATPPDRLSGAQIARWRSAIEQAWALVMDVCPDLAAPISTGLFAIVPQPAAERFRTMSASAGDAFGSMIMSEPDDVAELAVTMVHEFQHIKLGGLLHLTSLHRREPAQRLYAPWRDDPRPLGGLLQGVYAFVGIVEFWRALRTRAASPTRELAQFEFARWRVQVAATLATLRDLPELTDIGAEVIARMAATAAAWRDEPVPEDIDEAARAAVTDHRARWKLHHLRPASEAVEACVAAWRNGTGVPNLSGYAGSTVAADPSARGLDATGVIALWKLTDPAGFERLLKDPADVGTQVPGATPGHLAYADGDPDLARAQFMAGVRHDPRAVGPWAGLTLSCIDNPAAQELSERPELVRAVFLALVQAGQDVSPLALAAWLGKADH